MQKAVEMVRCHWINTLTHILIRRVLKIGHLSPLAGLLVFRDFIDFEKSRSVLTLWNTSAGDGQDIESQFITWHHWNTQRYETWAAERPANRPLYRYAIK